MKLDAMDLGFYGGAMALAGVVAVFFASGAFRGDSAPITTSGGFLFGEGPWMVWHFFLLTSLLAFGVGLVIAAAMTADESGIALIVMLTALGVLMLMSLVDGILWSTTLFDSWAARYLGGPVLIVAAWLGFLALVLVYHLALAYCVSAGWAGPMTVMALVAGIVVLNLFGLHAYHHASAT